MINNNKFDQELLGKIKKKKIAPKPRWHFLLKNYIFWSISILSFLVGSIAFSVILYLLRYNDWDSYSQIGTSLLGFILLTLPYFWLLFLCLFVIVVYFNFKHTKKGYCYSLSIILITNIIASIILGGIFFHTGVAEAMDNILGQKSPIYTKVFNKQIDFWSQPEEGRLSGFVITIMQPNNFILFDTKQFEWIIEAQDATSSIKVKVGKPIKIVGIKTSDNVFSAQKIMSVKTGKGFFKEHRRKPFMDYKERMRMIKHLDDSSKFRPKLQEFSLILKEYPDLKDVFENDFLEHKKYIKDIISVNPSFLEHLMFLDLDDEYIIEE